MIKVLASAFLITFGFFFLQGRAGFSLADEGFLWYGVQRVLNGEVPIRDFMSYDPGRYYWSAWYALLSGDHGIMGVRMAAAIFQAIGMFVALILIVRSTDPESRYKTVFWGLSALILILWMLPRHKVFDISLSIMLVGGLAYMIANPVPRRCLLAGIGVGLVAVFGRNHGVYGAAASLAILLWMMIGASFQDVVLKRFVPWGVGVVIGFLPTFVMAMVLPGFAAAFWNSILMLFEQKATNLPLPIPWPWDASFQTGSFKDVFRDILIGVFFLSLPLFGLASIVWVTRQVKKNQPVQPALVAAAFLTLPYAHYAFSRADVSHLAQGIFPFLIGALILVSSLSGKKRLYLGGILLIASLMITLSQHPGWFCRKADRCVDVDVSGSTLRVPSGEASNIALIRSITADHAAGGKSFIVTPLWPGAYALMERKSPVWEIYALFPKSEAFEQAEIERIIASDPGYALILDVALDGQDALRFRNTHPLMHRYIQENFELVEVSPNPALQLYVSKDATP
ncbi:hypothetical protein KX928_23740 [Roseobacter sp. YSTF-M11]|uniref:Uncharacterized protein n=1 Tax=Roseobacter insulae TaxID=2859783 RepID=A0A9X1G181_9RHOB|nr:hypothetical protein [Roseobacter insulae]MBW4710815.1 hypothetical protein [Roseobacter insulae]